MFNKKQFIAQLTEQTQELIRNNPFSDFENNFKTILQAMFTKLDLVTREEFDIQQQVLAHTRMKLADLEQQITQIIDKQSADHVNC